MQSVKRVTLTGAVKSVGFNKPSGAYLVKNFSNDDIYVSFESTVATDTAIKIASGMAQVCFINMRDGLNGQEKTTVISLKGTGEVEVQQIWY